MKKICIFLFALMLVVAITEAQTIATPFIKKDCNGQVHNLFNELDLGHVVIMEFFHTCVSCITAANDMKPMYQKLVAKYGNKVSFYVIPEDDSYPCSSVLNWVNSNGFSSMVVPFDSGAAQSAYYGSGGMPTIAIAAGSTHKLLYLASSNNLGFVTSDTTKIGIAIRNFLDSTFAGVQNITPTVSISVFPNPASESFELSLNTIESGILKLELTDILGQKLLDLTEEKIQTGLWNKNFSTSLPDGVYFVKGRINEKIFSEKITIQH